MPGGGDGMRQGYIQVEICHCAGPGQRDYPGQGERVLFPGLFLCDRGGQCLLQKAAVAEKP